MLPNEPNLIGLTLTVAAILLLMSAAFSRLSDHVGIPVVLVFLLIGILAGFEGVGIVHFADYRLAFRIGFASLALILFDGGLNTPAPAFRRQLAPAAALSSLGVLGTAGLMALAAHAIGFTWSESLLFGAVVSSTDAAAVFSVLRASGIRLRRTVGATLEIESGLNDPAAVVLTVLLTTVLTSGFGMPLLIVLDVIQMFVVGAAMGIAIGWFGRIFLSKLQLSAGGLYPIITIGVAFLAFGIPTLLGGSGFLSVYIAGIIIGNGPIPYRAGIFRVHDFAAWLCQIAMFLTLGLLVRPADLSPLWLTGVTLAVLLAVVVRPLVVLAVLIPFRFSIPERLFIGWTGLRGAVPIILAIFPVLAGVPQGTRIFDLVFFVVVVSVLLQGLTVGGLARRLGLVTDVPPPPTAALELISTRQLEGELLSFYIYPSLAVAGQSLGDIPLPAGAGVILVVRATELLAAVGPLVLEPGDYVYVLCGAKDRPHVQLLFGGAVNE